MSPPSDPPIPILTDVVAPQDPEDWPSAVETLIAELQTRLAAQSFALTEEIVRQAFAELEAGLFEQVSSRLRKELPELIDAILRERLEAGEGTEPRGPGDESEEESED